MMSLLQRIFGRKPPRPRIRICVECGVAAPDHKDWCSIFRHMQAQSQEQASD